MAHAPHVWNATVGVADTEWQEMQLAVGGR
jgi:hypothetical protein